MNHPCGTCDTFCSGFDQTCEKLINHEKQILENNRLKTIEEFKYLETHPLRIVHELQISNGRIKQ